MKTPEKRRVVHVAIPEIVYKKLELLCVQESTRRGTPILVARYIREMLLRAAEGITSPQE